jgi:hypothetical protein
MEFFGEAGDEAEVEELLEGEVAGAAGEAGAGCEGIDGGASEGDRGVGEGDEDEVDFGGDGGELFEEGWVDE